MPYITKERAHELKWDLTPQTSGELNYCITELLLEYLEDSEKRYQDYNEVIGVLECAKLELYRRLVAPYENLKRHADQNVDPYYSVSRAEEAAEND